MKQPKVSESLKINVPASGIWNRIKSFDRVEEYSGGMISHSEVIGQGLGCERICTMNTDQGKIVINEVITEFNDSGKHLKYSVHNPPMPVTNMENSISVKDLGASSEVTWESYFEAEENHVEVVSLMLQKMIKMNLNGIKNLF
ncbi:SRPBCC family protein [Gilvibacter sp.]|uniref:SRPBCC family protein n=1 Tax=Gilvibacter sp. TaxID=2729997 RepID=UPI003F49F948